MRLVQFAIIVLLIGLFGTAASAASKPMSAVRAETFSEQYINPAIIEGGAKAILFEGFEGATFPPAGWSLAGSAALWMRSTDCSGYGIGSGAALADFYNVQTGTRDLVSFVCTPTAAGDSLVFDRAYAPYTPGTYRDSLTIWTSINGGTAWVKLFGLVGGPGGTLNTAPATGNLFVPTPAQWATKKYVLPTGTNRIRFRAHTAYGNELYLDNIHVIPQAHDVGVAAIVAPSGQQSSSVDPMVLVKNFGTNTESFQVNFQILSNTTPVYSESLSVAGLAAGDTQTVVLPSWMPSMGELYNTVAWTNLAGDAVPANDTIRSTFNSYNMPRTVFGMDFTATWCTWCPWHQVAWKMLKDEVGDSLCVIALHPSTAAPQDSFYLASCATLATFYGLSGYPTSIFDGIDQFVGSDTAGAGVSQYTDFRAMFDARKGIYSPFGITLNGGYDSDTGSVTAMINYPGTTPIAVAIRCAIIETSKYMQWPVGGSNLPQDTLRDFVRIILPSATGDTITVPNGVTARNYPFTINNGWNKSKLAIVVWAALRGQKEVLQSKEIAWSDMVNGVAGSPVAVIVPRTQLLPCQPNPARGQAGINYNLSQAGPVSVVLYDITGRKVRTLVSGQQPAGSHGIMWSGSNDQGRTVAAGVYFVRLQAGDYCAAQKIVWMK